MEKKRERERESLSCRIIRYFGVSCKLFFFFFNAFFCVRTKELCKIKLFVLFESEA
jgi:hypothetical protein